MIRSAIVCDVCKTAEPVPHGLRVHHTRAELHALGWRQEPGGRDLCPECAMTARESPKRGRFTRAYPPRVCIDCGKEFVPRRTDGASLPRRCPECAEAWRRGRAMARG